MFERWRAGASMPNRPSEPVFTNNWVDITKHVQMTRRESRDDFRYAVQNSGRLMGLKIGLAPYQITRVMWHDVNCYEVLNLPGNLLDCQWIGDRPWCVVPMPGDKFRDTISLIGTEYVIVGVNAYAGMTMDVISHTQSYVGPLSVNRV